MADRKATATRRGPRTLFRVVGASMEPAFSEGDWLVVQAHPARLRFGDVVALRRGDHVVAHRVVGVKPPREMGDAMTWATTFTTTDVVGRVDATVRHGRTVSLRTPLARFNALVAATRGWARLVSRKACRLLPSPRSSCSI